ncbi:MAG: RNA 2'-phosphotransferase [Lachnospiraceae bacterium]|nr:RNA 2'-phosphotransferase [Lachnospiraceae bacterium]
MDELIAGINRTHPLTMKTLEQIVREDEKQRYSFNEDEGAWTVMLSEPIITIDVHGMTVEKALETIRKKVNAAVCIKRGSGFVVFQTTTSF